MAAKEKVAGLIERGAIQLSRKYRSIGVPPVLPEGKTFLDVLRERDPQRWAWFEDLARKEVVQKDPTNHVTLTYDEFNEWLVQRGYSPLADPPEPYDTWGQYWAENTEHPKGVRRRA